MNPAVRQRRSQWLAATLAALALALFCAGCAAPGTYTNPILYADYSDPDVIRVDDDYFLVASSFHFSPGLPVLHSKDLVHWRIAGHVLDRLDFHPAYDMVPPYTLTDATSKPVGPGMRYAGGVWAPSIRHHAGRYYVYWATPDEGIFMSSAAHPAGPWTKPVTVLAGPGYEDPCPFWDDDGKAWLVHSKVGAGPLILHAMRADGTALLDAGITIVEDKVNLPVLEGPKLYKRNGWYYIFAPIGGVGTGPQAVLRARQITGPYEYRTVLHPGNGLAGPHQGGYVETPSGQGWFIHFNSTGAFGRIAHLQPVTWRDAWPVIGNGGLPVLEHQVPQMAGSGYRLQDSDEFAQPALGLQWSWNHNPDAARWSLTERPGFLRIGATRARHLVGARNTLTQILQGPASEITTRIELQGMAEGQRAGLVLFGVKVPWIGVVREDGINHLTYANAGAETRGARIDADAVILRATVTADQHVRFAYALDGQGAFTNFGPATPLAKFSWWKGSRPAVFTYVRSDADEPKAAHAGPLARDYIDVDWFRVRVLQGEP
ncbi:beta-xylosidase [Pseudoduganella flava]|uniref:Beta-xylosidase n=1 Tax=Pseudoduganella flava TaxID=871742 RepID=A0A562Q0S9_9BURK|nr:glycoside hydrolase 43 family protein [Pseudoduganella flava]QGZ42909.1 family 43 glycosylhydrolase [Pseudoduganella flava]TWI50279.1 beta-xylosidase [Pseudoduganella flava]